MSNGSKTQDTIVDEHPATAVIEVPEGGYVDPSAN
jgi:hypothetical protein